MSCPNWSAESKFDVTALNRLSQFFGIIKCNDKAVLDTLYFVVWKDLGSNIYQVRQSHLDRFCWHHLLLYYLGTGTKSGCLFFMCAANCLNVRLQQGQTPFAIRFLILVLAAFSARRRRSL